MEGWKDECDWSEINKESIKHFLKRGKKNWEIDTSLLYHSDPESTGQFRTLPSLNLKYKIIQQSTFIEYWSDTIFGNLYTMKEFYAQNYEIILHKNYHQSMFGSTNYYVIPILKYISSQIF